MKKIFNGSKPVGVVEIGKNPFFWGALLFAMLLKYGYYGFTYFPIVDDHNMYGIFSMMSPLEALLTYRMYTTRVLAVLLDTYVISRLWGSLWIILLAMTLLHFFSSYLIYKVFEKNNVKTGAVLAIIFSLMPLGNDASYWIAASSRIVIGLFFAVLSFFLYMQYIEKGNQQKPHTYLYFSGFAVTNLISLGFYEQVIAFSFVGILVLMAVNFKRLKNKWIFVIPFVNIAIMGAYYLRFSGDGNMASRGQLLTGKYFQHTINVYKEIKELLTVVPGSLIKHGSMNGLQLLLADRAVLYILLAILASTALGICYAREKAADSSKVSIIKLITGLFLIFLPFAPFFVLEVIWIAYRNAFISLIGVGLIIESLAGAFFNKWDLKIFRGIIAGIVVFAFILGNVAEINSYKNISEIDREIVINLASALEEAKGPEWVNDDVFVFNTKPVYITTKSKNFSNCTAVDWALSGAMRSILRLESPVAFEPVAEMRKVLISREKLEKCTLIGMDLERRAFPLKGEWKSDGELKLYLENGELFGKVKTFEDDYMIFELG